MNKDSRVLGLLGIATKAGAMTFGTEAVKESIESKKAKLVIVANDASDKTIDNFIFICKNNKLPIIKFGTIDTLSKAIGKPNKAVISIKDRNLSEEIYKIICGGEAIG